MQIEKTIPFTHDGSEYTIRILRTPEGFAVRTYKGDDPANPYVYSIDFSTYFEFAKQHGDALKHLTELAEQDVRTNTWERYLEAIGRGTSEQLGNTRIRQRISALSPSAQDSATRSAGAAAFQGPPGSGAPSSPGRPVRGWTARSLP